MKQELILYPIFTMAGLTFLIGFLLLFNRIKAVRNRDIKASYFLLNRGEQQLPDYLVKVTEHYNNLFESPVLFYIALTLIYITETVSISNIILAWLYVFTRIAHAWINIGNNKLLLRRNVFMSSYLLLIIIWTNLAVNIFA